MPESNPTLLCVDDERGILNALRRLLRKEPYRLLTAESGEDALEILEQQPVQVVVSDYRMPGMSGTELLRKVKHAYPDTVRVVLSGYADVDVIVESINEGEIYRFLPKPWNEDELKVTLRQCFERHGLRLENRRLLEQVRQQNERLSHINEELEQKVAARTRSLQLSQEILEKLPLPVLGISREGIVVLANAAAGRLLPSEQPIPLGLHMETLLPPEVTDAIAESLSEKHSRTLDRRILHGRPFRLHIKVLQEGGRLRGCTLVFEEQPYEKHSFSTSSG